MIVGLAALQLVGRGLDQLARVEPVGQRRHRAGLQLRQVEQVLDHAAHPLALVGDRLQQLAIVVGQVGVAEAAGCGGDGHQRGAHVVGDGAEQCRLQLVRARQRLGLHLLALAALALLAQRDQAGQAAGDPVCGRHLQRTGRHLDQAQLAHPASVEVERQHGAVPLRRRGRAAVDDAVAGAQRARCLAGQRGQHRGHVVGVGNKGRERLAQPCLRSASRRLVSLPPRA